VVNSKERVMERFHKRAHHENDNKAPLVVLRGEKGWGHRFHPQGYQKH